jgi:hypothetical protein
VLGADALLAAAQLGLPRSSSSRFSFSEHARRAAEVAMFERRRATSDVGRALDGGEQAVAS